MQNNTIKKKMSKNEKKKLTPVQIGWNVIRLEIFFFLLALIVFCFKSARSRTTAVGPTKLFYLLID